MCAHKLGDLICRRLDAHDPDAAGGHIYESSTGSATNAEAPDADH